MKDKISFSLLFLFFITTINCFSQNSREKAMIEAIKFTPSHIPYLGKKHLVFLNETGYCVKYAGEFSAYYQVFKMDAYALKELRGRRYVEDPCHMTPHVQLKEEWLPDSIEFISKLTQEVVERDTLLFALCSSPIELTNYVYIEIAIFFFAHGKLGGGNEIHVFEFLYDKGKEELAVPNEKFSYRMGYGVHNDYCFFVKDITNRDKLKPLFKTRHLCLE